MDVMDTALVASAADGAAPRARAAALVRDVILGGQDGLVNVLGLVLGMAVATGDTRIVVTAGLAALLAESIAMGGVAFTASGAERQLAVTTRERIGREQLARAASRARERRRRLEAGLATVADVDAALAEADREASAWRDELEALRVEMAPLRETRPIRAAAVVGLSTAAGSAVPLLPFILLPIGLAPIVALSAGGVVLAVAGMERARLTGGDVLRAAAEMVAIGLVSAFAGYLIGQLLRVPTG
jgi:VIT1/CCC1 family predicted Fe2+/Mn2+ transporter